MKNLKLYLDPEEDESINIGLVRLAKPLPEHEFFYLLNDINHLSFKRIPDLDIEGEFFHYFHPVFEAYHREFKNQILFIKNRSTEVNKKKEITQLFADEDDVNFLLPNFKDVDYLIKTSDNIAEFSLILLPENIMFQIQNYELTSEEELYHLIQYYE